MSEVVANESAKEHHPSGDSSSLCPRYKWLDITDEFVKASDQLCLGELLHDNNFGLFEAMSAIEMMDPKMDAGMVCNQAKRPVYNFEQAIQAGTVRVVDLQYDETVGIIDDCLSCLVTWLEGHSLAQTVFTCLYLHNPYIIEDRPLKAFCICFLKVVDFIRDKINRASVYEEEDFQSMTYGFKMAADVTDNRALGMVKEVEEDLQRIIKTSRPKPDEPRSEEIDKEYSLAVALHCRLKFCRQFLNTLMLFEKEKCQGLTDAKKNLTQMLDGLNLMTNSVDFGVRVDAEDMPPNDYATIMGFDPLVNQRLLPPTFPRYTKIKDRLETIDYLRALCNRFLGISCVTGLNGIHQGLDFFMEFSKSPNCVFSRSILQLLYLSQSRRVFGITPMVDVIRDSIKAFISPPFLMARCPIATQAQAKEYVDGFLAHAVRPVTSMFQICGHNRARQRDKWGMLLEDLANLQDEGDKVDAYLHDLLVKVDPGRTHIACFGTWVLYHTLQAMIHYTLAGFQLELYSVHEYHYVFWYLYECLYSWLISTLSRAEKFYMEQQEFADQQTKGGSRKKKERKKKKQRPHTREMHLAQAAQSLCSGYYKAVAGFQLAGKLQQPAFDFDSEEVRYNHRFAPFSCLVTPPAIQFGQFQMMTDTSNYDPPLEPEDMYIEARKFFQQAKFLYENIPNPSPEILTLLKIAKTNFVVMNLLAGGHKKESDDPPEFDFTLHNTFPLIKIS